MALKAGNGGNAHELQETKRQRVIRDGSRRRRYGKYKRELEMWAIAQRDGRPAEYRWRPLLNAAVWLTPTTRVPCSNAAKMRNPLKLAGVPQTN